MRARAAFGPAAVGLVLAWSSPALAKDPTDGAYGRVDGDLLFVGELGAALAKGGPELETHVALLYLSTAGGYFRYVESFENDDAPFARLLAAGFELRPLFLGRYALNLEKGPPHLDLFVDSLALVIGATWESRSGPSFDPLPGLELGFSIDVPFLATASGPRVGVLALARWGAADLTGEQDRDFFERGASLVFSFSWNQIIDANLVDIRDR